MIKNGIQLLTIAEVEKLLAGMISNQRVRDRLGDTQIQVPVAQLVDAADLSSAA